MTGFQDKAQTLILALKAVYNLVSNDSTTSSTSPSLPYQVSVVEIRSGVAILQKKQAN